MAQTSVGTPLTQIENFLNEPSSSSPPAVAVAAPRSSWALYGLLLIATLCVMHVAQDVILPAVMAFVLSLVFSPVVRALKKLRIPAALGAAIVVLGLLAAFVSSVYYLAEPAAAWIDKAPKSMREIEGKLRRVTGSVKEVTSATEQVQTLTENLATGATAGQRKPQEVVVKPPSLASQVLDAAGGFVVRTVSILILLYFLLASEDLFLRKLIAAMPRLSDKKRAVDISRQIETEVSNYLFTVTAINAGLGMAVAIAMYFLAMPNPVLWGVMVGTFNFVPYLGDLASFTVLTVVGLLTFDELWRGLLVPATFYVLTAIEGYVITPLVLGRQLNLNPVVIVLSVLFWGWMWGILGALLAVPILVVLKTLCDRVDSLQVFGDFLGE